MSKRGLYITYKQSQIIKHALQGMIADKLRVFDNTPELLKDVEDEKRLLEKIVLFVDDYKQSIKHDKLED